MNDVGDAAARFEFAGTAVRTDLPSLLALAERAAREAALDETTAGSLKLAVEEACANVIEHAYPAGAPGPIRLAIDIGGERIVVVVEDQAPPFDPATVPLPDLDAGWESRRIGGLGWHLLRRLTDRIEHTARPGGGNRLTLIMRRHNHTGRQGEDRHRDREER